MNGEAKITCGHRDRLAVVYVRQSTLLQVRDNAESTSRQYGLSDQAIVLGWPAEKVRVIDTDLGCTEPGTHLPALAEIAGDLRLSTAVVRAALEQLATEGMVALHEGYRLYSVGTTTPTERAYRMLRTAIHRSYEPGERFMTRYDIGQRFDIGGKEAAAAVRQLIAEGLLTGPRGQYVNPCSPEQQRRRVKQLRERASDLRREALELMRTAREIEQELPTGGDAPAT